MPSAAQPGTPECVRERERKLFELSNSQNSCSFNKSVSNPFVADVLEKCANCVVSPNLFSSVQSPSDAQVS